MHRKAVSLAAVFLVTLSLGGCQPDRAKELAACRKQSLRFYANHYALNPDGPAGQYIIGCMVTKGYDFTITPEDCRGGRPLPTQATCYVPSGWLDWLVFKAHALMPG